MPTRSYGISLLELATAYFPATLRKATARRDAANGTARWPDGPWPETWDQPPQHNQRARLKAGENAVLYSGALRNVV